MVLHTMFSVQMWI